MSQRSGPLARPRQARRGWSAGSSRHPRPRTEPVGPFLVATPTCRWNLWVGLSVPLRVPVRPLLDVRVVHSVVLGAIGAIPGLSPRRCYGIFYCHCSRPGWSLWPLLRNFVRRGLQGVPCVCGWLGTSRETSLLFGAAERLPSLRFAAAVSIQVGYRVAAHTYAVVLTLYVRSSPRHVRTLIPSFLNTTCRGFRRPKGAGDPLLVSQIYLRHPAPVAHVPPVRARPAASARCSRAAPIVGLDGTVVWSRVD